jgi:hypothetical protein
MKKLAGSLGALAVVCAATTASASIVDLFTVTPSILNEGGTSTIDLQLFLSADPGFTGPLRFVSGTATLSSDTGQSITFNIPPGNIDDTFRDFSTTFTYPISGTFHPSFSSTVSYSELRILNCPPDCGSNIDTMQWSDSGSSSLEVLASAPLAVPLRPLPAAVSLIATAIGTLGLLGWWRRKRKVEAAA